MVQCWQFCIRTSGEAAEEVAWLVLVVCLVCFTLRERLAFDLWLLDGLFSDLLCICGAAGIASGIIGVCTVDQLALESVAHDQHGEAAGFTSQLTWMKYMHVRWEITQLPPTHEPVAISLCGVRVVVQHEHAIPVI